MGNDSVPVSLIILESWFSQLNLATARSFTRVLQRRFLLCGDVRRDYALYSTVAPAMAGDLQAFLISFLSNGRWTSSSLLR